MDMFLDTAKDIGIFLGQIVVALFFCKQYLQKAFKKKDVAKFIPKQNKIDMEIITKMDYVKELLNADRIHVYEFHNGEHYTDYRSAYKFSCTYEAVKAGSRSIRELCMHIPIACMPKFINDITVKGKLVCEDVSVLKELMPSTYNFKINMGIVAFYDIAIKNKAGNVVGFVAIQWDDKNRMFVDEEVIKQLVWFIEERLKEAV